MSVRKMAEVWEKSRHSGTSLLMLLAIADFADDDGRAYPAVTSLARKCRMKPRNAQTILASLRASGELVVRHGEGPKGTNLYRIPPLQSLAPMQANAPLQSLAPTPAKECATPLQGVAPKPSVNHQGTTRRTHTARKTPLPPDFQVSETVKAWAEKKGFDRLDEHLEAFKAKCAARGYLYIDHDAAFMEAIREDWAKLRRPAGKGRRAPPPDDFGSKNYGSGGRL